MKPGLQFQFNSVQLVLNWNSALPKPTCMHLATIRVEMLCRLCEAGLPPPVTTHLDQQDSAESVQNSKDENFRDRQTRKRSKGKGRDDETKRREEERREEEWNRKPRNRTEQNRTGFPWFYQNWRTHKTMEMEGKERERDGSVSWSLLLLDWWKYSQLSLSAHSHEEGRAFALTSGMHYLISAHFKLCTYR